MIVGLGVDIEEVERVHRLADQYRQRFLDRVFTRQEQDYCFGRARPYHHLAARFAAKEALSKALGTGWTGRFRWRDAEVMKDDQGKPFFRLHNELLEQVRGRNVLLSISQASDHVTATVIIERGD
ncbi:MAG: holo-[acyl-carrier-protein] synthase [Chlorobi bacterium]|nr:holo-[acyl-carrier-protein] synthase [Chlorobiota bacterium]